MLFVQVLKLKVSLPLCWHCSDICPTTANNLPTLSSECFWSQTLPREGRSISNSELKSFVDARSGGSLVRWAGTSPTSSTGPTSQPATSSWWTTSTTSTPRGGSPGRPSSTCSARWSRERTELSKVDLRSNTAVEWPMTMTSVCFARSRLSGSVPIFSPLTSSSSKATESRTVGTWRSTWSSSPRCLSRYLF